MTAKINHSKSIELYAIDWQHSDTPWQYWEHIHVDGFAKGMPFFGCSKHPGWEQDIIYRRKADAPVFEKPANVCEWTKNGNFYDLGCTKHSRLQQAAIKATKHCHECGGEVAVKEPLLVLAGVEFPSPKFYNEDGSEPTKFKFSVGAADYFFDSENDKRKFRDAIGKAISLAIDGVDVFKAQKQGAQNLAKSIGMFVEEIEPLLRGDMQEGRIIANKINAIVLASNTLIGLVFGNSMEAILDGRAGLLLDKLDGSYEDIWLAGKEGREQ